MMRAARPSLLPGVGAISLDRFCRPEFWDRPDAASWEQIVDSGTTLDGGSYAGSGARGSDGQPVVLRSFCSGDVVAPTGGRLQMPMVVAAPFAEAATGFMELCRPSGTCLLVLVVAS
jgi:hypothetical protein